jgi:hypothetical protein
MRQHESMQRVSDTRYLPLLCHPGPWFLAMMLVASSNTLCAQDLPRQDLSTQIKSLTRILEVTQAQLEESQRQLNAVRVQLSALQKQMAQKEPASPPVSATSAPSTELAAGTSVAASSDTSSSSVAAAIDELRERQALQESQIATHEQAKVESASKYPVKISGLVLFNGFVNTSQVDEAATPTVAVGGAGSTGATIKQTLLGFDARGPHIFGASSFADLRVDFAGSAQSSSGPGNFAGPYAGNSALLRLRTAHAALQWPNTQAFFALDRPIVSPDTPTSLAAVAEPALAWSGNLWTWNPQIGLTRDIPFGTSQGLRLQAALIDVSDPPATPIIPSSTSASTMPPGTAEQSRWPGVETRIALFRSGSEEKENHFGLGGYYAPHRFAYGKTFDSWAATVDANLHLPAGLEFTSSAYRGLALGGLGGGAYKDIAYYVDSNFDFYIHPLDSVGGWAQLKERVNNRLEFNAAFGTDMVFARQLRPYALSTGSIYQNLDATRTFTGNFIYSPSASLLFSVEYRRLESSPVSGATATSNIFGIAAGYKF